MELAIVGKIQNHQRLSVHDYDLTSGAYGVRWAASEEDLLAACRLRFIVFNLELNEGLASAYERGYDTDEFDRVCDHLIVEHRATGQVVGTYRMQTGRQAAAGIGYYSAREFDFRPYECLRDSLVELGRAAIHRDHRSFQVLALLWRRIIGHARAGGARYLVGCSSITSQCPQESSDMFWRLREFQTEPELRTRPLPQFDCPVQEPSDRARSVKPPKLLRAYLTVGARICGRPAIDREFGTIDFLTLLDLEQTGVASRLRFLR